VALTGHASGVPFGLPDFDDDGGEVAATHDLLQRCDIGGEGDLPPVDGEDPAALPGRARGAGGGDLRVQAPERVPVQPAARLAGRRRGGRPVLREAGASGRAPRPEPAERGPVSLSLRRGDGAEHDRHDGQAVEDAAALPPVRVPRASRRRRRP